MSVPIGMIRSNMFEGIKPIAISMRLQRVGGFVLGTFFFPPLRFDGTVVQSSLKAMQLVQGSLVVTSHRTYKLSYGGFEIRYRERIPFLYGTSVDSISNGYNKHYSVSIVQICTLEYYLTIQAFSALTDL